MTKDEFLKTLAVKGYDVGFGAKKNFASFDIVNKLPSWIGFISLSIGIIQVSYQPISFDKELSILLIIASIGIIYLDVFKTQADGFDKEGVRLTRIFNSLRDLYLTVKSDNEYDFNKYQNRYSDLINEYYSQAISKQVFMSQWYAHFKFFYELQIDWIDECLHFKFFKDKVPNSLKVTIVAIVIVVLICYLSNNGYC